MNKILYSVMIVTFSISSVLSTPNAYAHTENDPNCSHTHYANGDFSRRCSSSTTTDTGSDSSGSNAGALILVLAVVIGVVVLRSKSANKVNEASFDNKESKDDRIKPYLRLENEEVQTGLEINF